MENDELVTVYTVNHALEAELIRAGLQSEGIRVYLEGLNEALGVGIIPDVKVQVATHDEDAARRWIMSHQERHKHTT